MKKLSLLLSLLICLSVAFCGCGSTENPAALQDFNYYVDTKMDYVSIRGYSGNETEIIIPEEIEGRPVKYIGSYAFENNKKIKKIILPDTLVTIGLRAFSGCTNLEAVKFSQNLKGISDEAFMSCENLKEVILPDSLAEVATNAFLGCEKLEKLHIPDTEIILGESAFSKCNSLTEVKIHKKMKLISASQFYDCENLKSVIIEDGVKSLGYTTFAGKNKLESVTIPASVTTFKGSPFKNCKSLKSVKFLGNAPEDFAFDSLYRDTEIHYKKGTSGWDNTVFNRDKMVEFE